MGEESTCELELPGFRFHPTEEELLSFYLKNMIVGKKLHLDHIIGCLNIYHHDPWELPGLAKIGEREWYFFVPRDRKQGNGGRPSRITDTGFWKATGPDRKIRSLSDPKKVIGLKKTLVFYKGRATRASKTDWVMNEYRLPDKFPSPKDIVLCKIYRKATSLKVLEQRAAMGEEAKTINGFIISSPADPMETISLCSSKQYEDLVAPMARGSAQAPQMAFKKEYEEEDDPFLIVDDKKCEFQAHKLPELQVPTMSMDWTQDPFWTQLYEAHGLTI